MVTWYPTPDAINQQLTELGGSDTTLPAGIETTRCERDVSNRLLNLLHVSPCASRGRAKGMSSFLAIYLRDHHAAAVAGARVARRVATAVERDSGNQDLRRVASEIGQDLIVLEEIMRRLGVEPDRVKDSFSRIAERLGRLKLNGRLLRRSPLSDLLELETLVVGITGKQALWVSLREVPSIQIEELDQLFERAQAQKRVVENARVAAAKRSFGSAHTTASRI